MNQHSFDHEHVRFFWGQSLNPKPSFDCHMNQHSFDMDVKGGPSLRDQKPWKVHFHETSY
jgi:hypothetical protein